MDKPDCYKCEHRGDLVGDCHSKCKHPSTDEVGVKRITDAAIALGIQGDPHGIIKGWFNWPYNFDPIWLKRCNGFKRKEGLDGKEKSQEEKGNEEEAEQAG